MTALGPYRLDALVGRGATGELWRATRPGPVPQVVAIKRAPATGGPAGRDRLRREAAILAELDHPHIVRVLDVVDDGDGVAVVMPFARGGSLHDLLEERGRLTAGETVAVLAPVADALGSAHRRGVLHGDVKPANVLFTLDGEPLLADFGVARHLRRPVPVIDPVGEGGAGPVEGTAGYVDPELVATGRPEPGNDVYGLAVVAHLCLTGRLPHVGATDDQVLGAAEAGDHPPLGDDPTVPRALSTVVEAALARDPVRRPPTTTALAAALRAALPADALVLPGSARSAVLAMGASGGPAALADEGPDRAATRPRRTPPGTRAFGPRPPTPEPPARRSRSVRVAAVLVGLALGVAVLVGLLARAGLGSGGDRSPNRALARPRPGAAAPCPDLPPSTVPAGSEVLEADVLGTGCPVALVWDGRILSLRPDPADGEVRRYELVPRRGGTGQIVVGDWDCDGSQTPGYYQPATGVVSYFGAIPDQVGEEVSARARDTGVLGGRARVVAEAGGCDTVEVVPEA